jgi:hypothetical protein
MHFCRKRLAGDQFQPGRYFKHSPGGRFGERAGRRARASRRFSLRWHRDPDFTEARGRTGKLDSRTAVKILD